MIVFVGGGLSHRSNGECKPVVGQVGLHLDREGAEGLIDVLGQALADTDNEAEFPYVKVFFSYEAAYAEADNDPRLTGGEGDFGDQVDRPHEREASPLPERLTVGCYRCGHDLEGMGDAPGGLSYNRCDGCDMFYVLDAEGRNVGHYYTKQAMFGSHPPE